ncbi:hypothetical protein G9P44_002058 [Scheffersomyces stipitis]|nr:hypothetical protein G9P44_002058 [Scheffersomyces stipitis]
MFDSKSASSFEGWPSADCASLSASTKSYNEPCKYYVSKNKLGNGTFSSVYECKNKFTGSHYAAKMYKKRMVHGLEMMLQNEFQVLKRISRSHRNILALVDYFETSDKLYLITDIALGGELFDRIVKSNRGMVEPEIKEITTTIVSTVEYLHSCNIVHRDLKTENILFQSRDTSNGSDILLADFGLARILQTGEKLYDRSGTLSYMAPEMINRVGYTKSVDVWAIGVIVYFMSCGYFPFDCETDQETMEAIHNVEYQFEPVDYWNNKSPELKDFIRTCLQKYNRQSCQELLRHPFLSDAVTVEEAEESPTTLSSLSQQLRDSVSQLEHFKTQENSEGSSGLSSQSMSLAASSNGLSSKLSFIEKSRIDSLIAGVTLQGACCETPEQVSCFNTPLTSASVSRLNSYVDLHRLKSIQNDDFLEYVVDDEAVPSATSKFYI